MKSACLLFFAILLTASLQATTWKNDARLSALFNEAGVSGTFVLYDTEGDVLIGHDEERARRRFLPASTFKVANSLIGLSCGAVASVDEVLPFGGGPQFLKSWEKDMGLREALPISNVPIYQELARRIGLERMQAGVSALSYGNREIGTEVDTFWLKGPLEISAVEQTHFLAQLASGTLPSIEPDIQAAVRQIMLLEEGRDWTLHGKTGWASSVNPPIGWWVGWIIQNDHIHSFALNIDIVTDHDGAQRVPLAKACLRELGFQLPEQSVTTP